jgi:hypothetical protein
VLLDEFQVAIERLEKLNFDPRLDGPSGGGSQEEDAHRRLIHLAEGLETIHWKPLHKNRALTLAARARASAQQIAQQHELVFLSTTPSQALGASST